MNPPLVPIMNQIQANMFIWSSENISVIYRAKMSLKQTLLQLIITYNRAYYLSGCSWQARRAEAYLIIELCNSSRLSWFMKENNCTYIQVVGMLAINFALAEPEVSTSLIATLAIGHGPEPFPHNLSLKIHLNVILPPQSGCCKWAFYKTFTHKYSVLITCLAILAACRPRLRIPTLHGDPYESWRSSS
jgi:hypothetical protein